MIFDLFPTEDQAAIRDSVASVIAKSLPVTRLQEAGSFGAAAEVAAWDVLAGLGLFGLGVAEADGGVGYTLAEEVTVAREFGKGLISPTVLATMIGAHVASANLLAALMEGSTRIAFANPIGPVDFSQASIEVQLLDVDGAEHVLIWNDAEARLYKAPADLQPFEAIDDTVSLSRATLFLADPVAVKTGPQTARAASLMLAAALAGIAEAATAMAVEYAKVREQFNQPIGAFQSIKHYCADMALRAEAAVAQTFYATLDAVGRTDDDMFEAAAARLLAGNAALENGRYNIQIHGGMGFTYEAGAHLFLKRAWMLSGLNSGERQEQQRILASAGPA
jgi:alkylation response protein AidB-like acyl-CoA dehydrogenase